MSCHVYTYSFSAAFQIIHCIPICRIQSETLPSVAPILETLIERVEKSAQPKIRLANSSPLPISALISLVDAHYKSYQNVQVIRVSRTFRSFRIGSMVS